VAKITRSEIRHLARTGQLTPQRIAEIDAAMRSGNVSRDASGGDVAKPQPLIVEPQQPRIGGTPIAAQPRPEVRMPKLWWLPR
jgi:hypothetical protein